MNRNLNYFLRLGVLCGAIALATPITSFAAIGPGFEKGTYVATITANKVNINKSENSDEVLVSAKAGDTYEVLEDMGNGWMRVRVLDTEGFLPVSGNATVSEVGQDQMAEVQKEAITSSDSYKRQQVVNYAMQFVGGPYRFGGSDPHTGVDCSGFTRYVLQNAAGVGVSRSSGSQATQGTPVSAAQMRPGDLLFYGSGSHVSHVAMYIGNGRVVHASTERVGITVSPWNYRTPVRIMDVLG